MKKNKKIFNVSMKEKDFYLKILKIKLWKDLILELGALNHFRKNKLEDPTNPEYIRRFIIENRRGYIDHLFSIITGTLLIFFFPAEIILSMGLPIILTNFIMNYMPLAVLRFNTPRLQSILKFSERNLNQ